MFYNVFFKSTALFIGLFLLIFFALNSCAREGFFKTGDARKISPDPRERVKKNLEEGKGFRLNNMVKKSVGGNFEFASSNELWRASLDVLSVAPLISTDALGGTIITDWYVNKNIKDKRIKITAYIKTSELRSDGVNVKVHVQKLDSGVWTDTYTDKKLASQIENNILNEARNYRINSFDK